MMEKISFIIILNILWACQSVPQYRLEGNIDHFSGKVWLITYNEQGQADTLGSSDIKEGHFKLKGSVEEPLYAWLQLEKKNIRIPVFLENTLFTVKADAYTGGYEVSGGALQAQRQEFSLQEKVIRQKRDSLRKEYKKAVAADELFTVMHIRALLMDLDSLAGQTYKQFISTHDNLVAASLIRDQLPALLRRKELHTKYALLGDTARNSVVGKELKYCIDHQQVGGVGRVAPDFTLPTPEGREVSLYEVKAKVKIVDFWASWCGPCRAENPAVREIYHQFHDKGLEIISVSLDSKKELWTKAIEKDQLPWIHVSDLKGWDNAVAKLYGVKGIPYLLVLDGNNRIVGEKLYGQELIDCIAKALQ